jgi:hypothetical protein
MRITTAAAVAAAVLALAGCTGSGTPHRAVPSTRAPSATVPAAAPGPRSPLATNPTTASCWWAIHDQYTPGTTQLTADPTLPPACAGLSPDDIPDIRNDVLAYLSNQ